MAADDDSDYELMSRKDIDRLKREKKGESSEKYSSIENTMERLNASINKLISILEDAQEDIIDEYQESKPVEKLNQLMDQNETIAKAILSMHSTLKKGLNIQDDDVSDSTPLQAQSQSTSQPQGVGMPFDSSMPPIAQMPQLPNSGTQSMGPSRQQQPVVQQRFTSMPQQPLIQQPIQQQPNPMWNQQQQRQFQYGPAPMNSQNPQGFQNTPGPYGMQQGLPDINSLEGSNDLPPLDMAPNDLPPLDNLPPDKKKKFLGFI